MALIQAGHHRGGGVVGGWGTAFVPPSTGLFYFSVYCLTVTYRKVGMAKTKAVHVYRCVHVNVSVHVHVRELFSVRVGV